MTSPTLKDLPADNYGVLVENKMDAKRLQYLVAVVGEEKVRKSALKCKYPPIYVSELLKRFRVRVPPHIYTATNIPCHHVYILAFPYELKIKLGVSGYWLRRSYAFMGNSTLEHPDSKLSIGINFQGDKKSARSAEKAVLSNLSGYKTQAPKFIPWGSYGHHEWLCIEAYEDALYTLRHFQSEIARPVINLKTAREHDEILWQDALDIADGKIDTLMIN
ncbi:hypothetical protein [Lysobacter enzymogenes]|uniref:hypothetical protein n=1 Tax=Lysobacter enzymogenes TaxID=69 RepID=UPI000F4C2647|nr:hypothetical protein [Lysobacter enzymogenes]